MRGYHKIDSVYRRDPENRFRTFIEGDWAQDCFGYLARNEWTFTEKVDGTNIRVMVRGDAVTFGGRSDNAAIPTFLVRKLEERFLPQKDALLAAFPNGGCLYGEGYGDKIQKGGDNYRLDQDFVLFDARVGDFWLERHNVEDVAVKFGLDVVPIIGRGTLHDMVEMARAGFNSQWGAFGAEGIVARPAIELETRSGHRIITKVKHRDFAAAAKAAA